ncbi:hypothetical protein Taro_037790 [Colocasia esculenta]|uniref:Uncharacterized protein n=1 Tax=Colocasia esculenta TaxID=4460 RepID=A0A843WAU0_COLES|nr:hypothetical protein [Colocasia esculenta]
MSMPEFLDSYITGLSTGLFLVSVLFGSFVAMPREPVSRGIRATMFLSKLRQAGFRMVSQSRSVRVELGDGWKCKFWKDKWCGDFTLESLFLSLFALTVDPQASVAEAFDEHLRGGAWAPTFRRHFLLEEEEEF